MEIFIYAGEGGHLRQANILKEKLLGAGNKVQIITEADAGNAEGGELLYLPPSSKKLKSRKRILYLPYLCVNYLICLSSIIRATKQRHIVHVGLGPFVNIPLFIICRYLRRKVIFIESRSRFTRLSGSNKLVNRLGGQVLVQNRSLFESTGLQFIGRLV